MKHHGLQQDRDPQYGVLGLLHDKSNVASSHSSPQKNIILSNLKEPFSTFICGSQGSGKSHTLSCLLENSLLVNPEIGTLRTPQTGMVFHYDKFAGYGTGQACESAYLCSAGVPVKILVAPTSLTKMTRQYSNLPGLSASARKPKVVPLYFKQEQLSVDAIMTLMAVQDTGITAPLYINSIRQALREIAMARQDTPGFDYVDFRHRLACLSLTEGQCTPLNLRLELLESFLLGVEQSSEVLPIFEETWRFEPGTLTIVDLSDHFVNESDACAMFSICLKLFMDGWRSNARIIALDEAHKFLTGTSEASKLTNDLVAIVRQQRHFGARVVVATQEPTVSGDFLDLCNVSIVHRFNSPKWYSTIKAHLAGANATSPDRDSLFQEIVRLRTGEAMVFCPTAALMGENCVPQLLQDQYMKIRIRNRVSADGGKSMLSTDHFSVESNEVSSSIPNFARFDATALPRPGSLAGKVVGRLPHGNNSSEKGLPCTNIRSVEVPSASTANPLPNAPFSPQGRSADADSSIAGRVAIVTNAVPNHSSPETSQELLASRLRSALNEELRTNTDLYKENPRPHLKKVIRTVSLQYGLPVRHLRGCNATYDGREIRATSLLRQLLKEYCDNHGVLASQRADLPWLK